MESPKAIRSNDGTSWGVGGNAWLLYDAIFTRRAAMRVAQLERRNKPPVDWHATKALLEAEGFSDSDIFAPGSFDG